MPGLLPKTLSRYVHFSPNGSAPSQSLTEAPPFPLPSPSPALTLPLCCCRCLPTRHKLPCHLSACHCHLFLAALRHCLAVTTTSPLTRFAELPMPPLKPAPLPGATVNTAIGLVAGHAHALPLGTSHRGSVVDHAPQSTIVTPPPNAWRNGHEMPLSVPGVINQSFFAPAQAHVGESVQFVLVTTNISSPGAMVPNCGTGQMVQQEKTSREGWLLPTVFPSASTGKCPKAALPQVTPTATGAPGVEAATMEPKTALERRKREPLSPYPPQAWASELLRHGLQSKYPSLVRGLTDGFDLGIPRISHTYTPPNHLSISSLPNVYRSIVDNEFATGRYLGPYTRSQLEALIGPFQTSPLSLVPKASKPGKYRAVHDFSYPHSPSPHATSINSHINSDLFPCTWGTFSTVALLVARLPPGSQASVRDVAEAYRTIPVTPSQWPGLVIRLQSKDQFAVNTCNNLLKSDEFALPLRLD